MTVEVGGYHQMPHLSNICRFCFRSVGLVQYFGSLDSLWGLCLVRFRWGFVEYVEVLSSIFAVLLPNVYPHPMYTLPFPPIPLSPSQPGTLCGRPQTPHRRIGCSSYCSSSPPTSLLSLANTGSSSPSAEGPGGMGNILRWGHTPNY